MRNVDKIISETENKIPAAYDMNASQIRELMGVQEGMSQEDLHRLYEAVCNAFVYGFAMGTRAAARKGAVKK